jgi:hypothetical protein
MALKRLSLVKGNTITYACTMKTAGLPRCIKNWVVFFTIKPHPDVPDAQASLQKIITTFSDTTSGTSGLVNIPITAADTANMDVGEYYWDIKVLTAESESFTPGRGMFDLEFRVTNSTGTAGTTP